MRRLLTGFVLAAVAAIVPTIALAGNQEVAEQIANQLRKSGQMSNYKIGVKYQDGTAWLQGRVSSQEQMKTALRLTFQVSAVDRIVNDLNVESSETAAPAENQQVQYEEEQQAAPEANPLRGQGASTESLRPAKKGLLGRFGSLISISAKPTSRAPQSQPARQDEPAYADRVPTEETPSAVMPVAAEQMQDSPRPLAMPSRVTPVNRVTREPARVAMMQPMMRGPVAPNGNPMPMYTAGANPAGVAPARYDQPCMPNYAWPSYAAYPNYAAVTYPKQYSPTVWPYIGPFYPYPQVPLGWRKVTLEWDSGWWFLDFKDQPASCWHR